MMKTLFSLLCFLVPTTLLAANLPPGVTYFSQSFAFSHQTLEVHVIEINMARKNLWVHPVIARGFGSSVSPLRTLSDLAASHPHAIAGISGGYFFEPGQKDAICEGNNTAPPDTEHAGDGLVQINAKTFAFNCAQNPVKRDQFYARSVLVLSGKHAPYIVSVSPNTPLFLNYDEKPDALGAGPLLIASFWPEQPILHLGQEGYDLTQPHVVNAAAMIATNAKDQRYLLLIWVQAKPQGLSQTEFGKFLLSPNFQQHFPSLTLVSAMALMSNDRTQMMLRNPKLRIIGADQPIYSAILVERR